MSHSILLTIPNVRVLLLLLKVQTHNKQQLVARIEGKKHRSPKLNLCFVEVSLVCFLFGILRMLALAC